MGSKSISTAGASALGAITSAIHVVGTGGEPKVRFGIVGQRGDPPVHEQVVEQRRFRRFGKPSCPGAIRIEAQGGGEGNGKFQNVSAS